MSLSSLLSQTMVCNALWEGEPGLSQPLLRSSSVVSSPWAHLVYADATVHSCLLTMWRRMDNHLSYNKRD